MKVSVVSLNLCSCSRVVVARVGITASGMSQCTPSLHHFLMFDVIEFIIPWCDNSLEVKS